MLLVGEPCYWLVNHATGRGNEVNRDITSCLPSRSHAQCAILHGGCSFNKVVTSYIFHTAQPHSWRCVFFFIFHLSRTQRFCDLQLNIQHSPICVRSLNILNTRAHAHTRTHQTMRFVHSVLSINRNVGLTLLYGPSRELNPSKQSTRSVYRPF
jgi:hypothetical protein